MKENNAAVQFLYGSKIGRQILKVLLKYPIDHFIAQFLSTSFSKPFIYRYVKRHNIHSGRLENKKFNSFQEFFSRKKKDIDIDAEPEHLISPCDGWLSAYPIHNDSSFFIKGSHYRLRDILNVSELDHDFYGGTCLVFRLCPADYHRYCYIDDGYQCKNYFIPGELHSVQPKACEAFPVYTLNRRLWTILDTEHFGLVVQTAVGALLVGGIINERENEWFKKGEEMGRFELSGSTIVMLFQKNQIDLLPHIVQQLANGKEYRVNQGMWIGNKTYGVD